MKTLSLFFIKKFEFQNVDSPHYQFYQDVGLQINCFVMLPASTVQFKLLGYNCFNARVSNIQSMGWIWPVEPCHPACGALREVG